MAGATDPDAPLSDMSAVAVDGAGTTALATIAAPADQIVETHRFRRASYDSNRAASYCCHMATASGP